MRVTVFFILMFNLITSSLGLFGATAVPYQPLKEAEFSKKNREAAAELQGTITRLQKVDSVNIESVLAADWTKTKDWMKRPTRAFIHRAILDDALAYEVEVFDIQLHMLKSIGLLLFDKYTFYYFLDISKRDETYAAMKEAILMATNVFFNIHPAIYFRPLMNAIRADVKTQQGVERLNDCGYKNQNIITQFRCVEVMNPGPEDYEEEVLGYSLTLDQDTFRKVYAKYLESNLARK